MFEENYLNNILFFIILKIVVNLRREIVYWAVTKDKRMNLDTLRCFILTSCLVVSRHPDVMNLDTLVCCIVQANINYFIIIFTL